ncbi:glycosyltransferase family 1 protein [Pedobacter yulinensis]|uniref:Glycosyltransferase family 1 protein n=1 Tax=Pedobacter yulinensis TaxID=2126353 RepID=A0A2T3HJ84_9SPHI|nr:glycosyltransferase family 1 protein [Pedobacter yulinensis]
MKESSASVTGAELSSFSPVTIGFDGKRAANNSTGLGNYSRWLIGTLARTFPGQNYLVYTPKRSSGPAIDRFLSIPGVALKTPAKKSLFWRSFGVIRDLLRDRVQLFHGLSHEIPFAISKTRIRSVVTIHDLIFLKFPQWYKPADRLIYKLKSQYACRQADQIIAISERTKQDIVQHYGIDPSRIEVVYQSCDPAFRNKLPENTLQDIRSRYALPAGYLLNVGTIEVRKNLLLLIEALPHLSEPALKLVVVGKKTPYFARVQAAIDRLQLENRVIFLENVPFADLPGIYQCAKIFVYPSRYEGFGIPLLEALHSGVPVVAATGSCLEEAGGPGGLYVSPDDAPALAGAINRILTDHALRAEMIRSGTGHLQQFDDALLAGQLMKCYLKLLNHVETGN